MPYICLREIPSAAANHRPRIGPASEQLRLILVLFGFISSSCLSFLCCILSLRLYRQIMPQDALSDTPVVPALASGWNTRLLGSRFGVDIASAATAGALTCPAITVIDRYSCLDLECFGGMLQTNASSCQCHHRESRQRPPHPSDHHLMLPIYDLPSRGLLPQHAFSAYLYPLHLDLPDC